MSEEYHYDHKDMFDVLKLQKVISKKEEYGHHSNYGLLQIFAHFLEEVEEMKQVIDTIFEYKGAPQKLIELFEKLIEEYADGSNCLDMMSDHAYNIIDMQKKKITKLKDTEILHEGLK